MLDISGALVGIGELVDTALVTPAGKFSFKKSGDGGLGHFYTREAGTDGEAIGIVMFARKSGRQRF